MDHDVLEKIRARRDALRAQMETAKAQYGDLERALALLQRNIDAMHGGLQELESLITSEDDHAPAP